jgi:hypothetical protein
MSPPSRDQIGEEAPPHPVDIVCDILREVETLPRLMEIHYLVQEPGMLDIMRGVGALSDDDRNRLRDYLARHSKARLHVREMPRSGALILELVDETSLDKSA